MPTLGLATPLELPAVLLALLCLIIVIVIVIIQRTVRANAHLSDATAQTQEDSFSPIPCATMGIIIATPSTIEMAPTRVKVRAKSRPAPAR